MLGSLPAAAAPEAELPLAAHVHPRNLAATAADISSYKGGRHSDAWTWIGGPNTPYLLASHLAVHGLFAHRWNRNSPVTSSPVLTA